MLIVKLVGHQLSAAIAAANTQSAFGDQLPLLIPLLSVSPPPADPTLSLEYRAGVLEFHVDGPDEGFLGAVILSLNPSVCHYLHGLPPLLCDHVVLGVGAAEGTYVASMHESLLPAGMFIHAQGVIAAGGEIQSTKVIDFVLDGSLPPSTK